MASGDQQTGFLSPTNQAAKEPRNFVPWVLAGVVVLAVVAVLLILGGYHKTPANPGGAGLAPADPYAASLAITDVKMSESSSMAGAKLTYLDGVIANRGDRTVTGLTVQVAFHDYTHQLAQKETMPMSLIRTREPYVDTQPVSAAPIKPGESREFRLIFDHVADSWNQEYPELRVIQVSAK
jgi:hypothetical protein